MDNNRKDVAREINAAGERSISAYAVSGIASTGDNATNIVFGVDGLLRPSHFNDVHAVSNLPRLPTKTFVGRAEMLECLRVMPANDGRFEPCTHVICGLGGVGKSELVLHHIERCRAEYRVVWWIVSDSKQEIREGLAALARRIYPAISLLGDVEAAAEWAVSWLQINSDWLLVLDNVENLASVRPYLAQLSNGHLIITTRRNVSWPNGIRKLQLEVLSPTDSVTLVEGIVEPGLVGSGATVSELVEELGFLPLALDQATAYINQSQISISRYLELLKEDPRRTYRSHSEERAPRDTIARLWKITLRQLPARNRMAVTVLNVLAHYAPTSIPRASLAPSDVVDLDEVLGILSSYSLIELRDDSIVLHRLLRAVLLVSVDSGAESRSLATIALLWLRRKIPKNMESNESDRAIMYALMPHIRCLADQVLPGDDDFDRSIGVILNNAAVFERVQGSYASALELILLALDFTLPLDGVDDEDSLMVRNNLAAVLWDLGRRSESMAEMQNVKDAATRLFISCDQRALTFLRNAASLSALADNPIQIEADVRKNLEASLRLLGDSHPQTVACRIDLAVVLNRSGRPREAFDEISKLSLNASEELDEDSPELIHGRKHRVNILHALGEFEAAQSEVDRLVEHLAGLLGDDHPDTLTARDTRACTLHARGLVEDATVELREILEVRERVLGKVHPETLTSLSNLASCLRESGDFSEAEEMSRKAVELSAVYLGTSHPDTLASRNNLANLLDDMGRHSEAEAEIRETIELRAAALGMDHPDTLTSRNNLAVMFVKRGRFEEAVDVLDDVIDRFSRVLSEWHPFALLARRTQIGAMAGMRLYARAELEACEMVAACMDHLGENHSDTREGIALLAWIVAEAHQANYGILSRNAPCSCGSRKKFKRCCGAQ
ncbi:tetratricopeptide repeat protein [Nonomuraea endophytica]|uniref:Tetratricopeptide (TPR) repeat protein n=1 Tax=Nonomuraea endophytica TaxID=714136 RepID=A0A7W8ACL3_9ACTN|nr:tetratricopeptide repeat protein [Nonomuraea endophytica]MBB5083774.1 tetratricopeptide (TPR) repeat protein [Nonomuraea endophytica]